jgi:LysM repeat protein
MNYRKVFLILGSVVTAVVLAGCSAAPQASPTATLPATPQPTLPGAVTPSPTPTESASPTPVVTATSAPSAAPTATTAPAQTTSTLSTSASSADGPQISISPLRGPGGTIVTIYGSGFPEDTQVNLTAGAPGTAGTVSEGIITDSSGNFVQQISVAGNLQAGDVWNFTATIPSTNVSIKAAFVTVAPPPTGPYTVQSGDTLDSVAGHFGVSLGALLRANPSLSLTSQLTTGQQLYIPGSVVVEPGGVRVYVVRDGDSLSSVAALLGVSVADLVNDNSQVSSNGALLPGTILNIPGTSAVTSGTVVSSSAPSVSLSPTSGAAGTNVTITASGFPANAVMDVGTSAAGIKSATTLARTDANGSFTISLQVPEGISSGAIWNVYVTTQAYDGPQASAVFAVN